MPTPATLMFQNAMSPLMEQLIFFHDYAMTFIILIMSIVSFNMYKTLTNNSMNINMMESHNLELFWTISPSAILLALGIPSIRLLYLIDETFNPLITIKTTGHQWYWSYEFTDFSYTEFDSYINSNQTTSQFRLLETDNQIFIPINSQIRNLITAADVLHAWTVPSLGVKVDAVPGRLNQINFISVIPNKIFGQCSEICGANHSFMPITLNSVPPKHFINWLKTQ